MTFPRVALSELADINPRAPKEAKRDLKKPVSFVPMSEVSEQGYIASEETREIGDVLQGYTYFARGDVLLAKITPCLENGKAAIADSLRHEIGFGTTEFHVLRAKKGTHPRYLFHQIWNARFRFFAEKAMKGAAGQKRVPTDFFDRYEVPAPNYHEQERIAAILDKADAIRRKRQQAIQLADEFLRSVFLNMFGDPSVNPKSWKKQTLGELVILGPDNGIFRKNEEYGEGLPVVWVEQLYRGDVLDISLSRRLAPTAKEHQKYGLSKGDIVFCRSSLKREGIGFNNIYDGENGGSLFECHMTRVRLDAKKTNPFFVNYLLRTKNMRTHVIAQSKTVTMTTIDQDGISRIEIILPPKDLQDKFETILRKITCQKQKYLLFIDNANQAFSSLSQRAFNGEL